jgi:hypothetical protein
MMGCSCIAGLHATARSSCLQNFMAPVLLPAAGEQFGGLLIHCKLTGSPAGQLEGSSRFHIRGVGINRGIYGL